MSAVEEAGKGIQRPETRKFAEVCRGYTCFAEGDVLFAKITPCMQNAKHAVATSLRDGIGFGSTEFHVLRPGPELVSDWLHLFLIQPTVLGEAEDHLTGTVGQQRLPEDYLGDLQIPLPKPDEQRRIATALKAQLASVTAARAALAKQIDGVAGLVAAILRESLSTATVESVRIQDCLSEVTEGIGASWQDQPVLGATRAGLAEAKDPVGKYPERYKPVRPGTIFYNPMRILLQSIAMVDDGDTPGITSPDYVVMRAIPGKIHPRWFYHWFRSEDGLDFIRSLSRGAVRERLLFKRLAPATLRVPPWPAQERAAAALLAATQLQRQVQSRLDTLDALPAALMRQVFGEPAPAGG